MYRREEFRSSCFAIFGFMRGDLGAARRFRSKQAAAGLTKRAA
jgi:hypothetical protein